MAFIFPEEPVPDLITVFQSEFNTKTTQGLNNVVHQWEQQDGIGMRILLAWRTLDTWPTLSVLHNILNASVGEEVTMTVNGSSYTGFFEPDFSSRNVGGTFYDITATFVGSP